MNREINNLIISVSVMDNNKLINKIVKNSFVAFQGNELYMDTCSDKYIIVKDHIKPEIVYYIELAFKDNGALINYISELNIDKYSLLTSLKSIKEIDNIKIIVDNFSNTILVSSYQKLYILENLLRLAIVNELINEYKDNFKNYIRYIEHYEEKRKYLPNKLNNILQRTDFNSFLKYIESNNLGGNESNRYKEVIEDKEKLKELRDKDIFNNIKNVIGGNCAFNHVKETILHFRNFIAHNKVIEDDLFEKNCVGVIDKINQEIINTYMSNSVFNKLNFNENSIINGTLLLIEKELCGIYEQKIYFMKILLELNIISDINIENEMLVGENNEYKFRFYKLEMCSNLYVLYIEKLMPSHNSNIDMEKLIKYISKDSLDIYYIFDFSSNSYNKCLYKEFNFLKMVLGRICRF
ncbi:hypothetical protein [Clostridium ljungdahlii]|uniref:hypothetical protein n=1 Tax=Clostridium ljungdahlii TaxID=1538 RepID=UPI00386EEE68